MRALDSTQRDLIQKLRNCGDQNICRIGFAVIDFYQSGREQKRQAIIQALREVVSEMYFYQHLKEVGYQDKEAVARSVRIIGKDTRKELHQLCNCSIKTLKGDFDEFWEKLSLVLSN